MQIFQIKTVFLSHKIVFNSILNSKFEQNLI